MFKAHVLSQEFWPKGGQNEIVWIIGGGGGNYLSVSKAWGKLGGAGAMLPRGNFFFLTVY